MKRIAAAIAGLSLIGLGATAAEETTKAQTEKTETKTEAKRNDDGTKHVKTVKKHKKGKTTDTMKSEHKMSKDMGGGTTETKEMKSEHDMPGMSHDSKMEQKETTKRDAQGNVIEHEKKDDAK